MWSIRWANDQAALRQAVELLGLGEEVLRPPTYPPCPFAGKEEPAALFRAVLVFAGETPVAAVGLQRLSRGRGVLYLPPQSPWTELPPMAADGLAEALRPLLLEEVCCLWQVLLDDQLAHCWGKWLGRLDFRSLATVQYWRCAPGNFPEARPIGPGDIVAANTLPPRQLAALVEQTYEGSQDFPELAGLDTAAEALASYWRTGQGGDEHWYVGLAPDGTPAGAILLAQSEPSSGTAWELCYLGVVPRFRRCGWGRFLLRHAQWQARRHAVREILLGVDQRNQPAARLYEETGFTLCQQRRLFCRLPQRAEPSGR